MTLDRRQFLKSAGAVSLGFAGLGTLLASGGRAAAKAVADGTAEAAGFGPLIPDPLHLLDLPAGFEYRILSRTGHEMDDGLLVPGKPDGMAAFPGPNGHTILIRNHEISTGDHREGAWGLDYTRVSKVAREMFYDAGDGEKPCLGGTTRVVYDTERRRVVKQELSLAGTVRNCAGGPTPWGSWITCEEDVTRPQDDARHAERHGYTFEVPAHGKGLAEPRPIRGMGRFYHEALSVDPASGCVYLTEDRHDGLIYRYTPNVPGRMHEGGRLQALMVADRPSMDMRNWEAAGVPAGERLAVRWMDLEDIEPVEDDLRFRGFEAGAARFARAEGMWYGRDAVYFACTNGGPIKKGQIWRYHPSPAEGTAEEAARPGHVELFIEPNDESMLDMADNVTVAPWGDLIVCEDGSGEQFLVGVTPEGELYKLARNAAGDSEMAGACFSPDGSTLFFNIQHRGVTVAVTGPWHAAAAHARG